MTESTAPEENQTPADNTETAIIFGSIVFGVVIGFSFSSFILGFLAWILSGAIGLQVKKAIDKVGLRNAPGELVSQLSSGIRKEFAESNKVALTACRACGHQVAVSAETCPQCGVAKPASNAIQRGFDGLNKFFNWAFVVVIVCLVIGAVTNPNEESLREYVRNQLRSEAGELGATIGEPFIQTKYESFFVFSVGKIEMIGGEELSRVVGFLGSWREIDTDKK